MRARRGQFRGFTLIEIIMVMVIVAIVAAVVAPSLRGFTIGRKTSNAATQIVGLAMYARAQAISEGRPYRLNFDTTGRNYWLTYQNGGAFQEPGNDYGTHYTLPDGVKMDVNVNGQFNAEMNIAPDAQQVAAPGNPLTDQPALQPNQLMRNMPDQGATYVQFLPSGRSDCADVKLTDATGKVIEVSCASATELFHIVKPGESR